MLTFKQFCRIEEESTAKKIENSISEKAEGQEDQKTSVH